MGRKTEGECLRQSKEIGDYTFGHLNVRICTYCNEEIISNR